MSPRERSAGPGNPSERRRVDDSALLHARVLESMVEGVSATNEHGVLIYSSRAHDAMFGYAPGELLGKHAGILNAYPPEENVRFTRDVLAQLRERGEWVGEISNVRKDGTPFTTRARMTGLDLGGKLHWVCVQEDLTSHKRLEEAQRQGEERWRFLAQAGERLLASLDVAQTFATLAQLVSGHLQENCLVESFDEDGVLRTVAMCYLDPRKEELLRIIERDYGLQQTRSVRMQAVQERRALVVEPTEERLLKIARDAEHLRLLRALGTTRIAIIPLVARGRSLGVLTVSSCRPGRDFSQAELGLLEELATRAAVAIDNARLYAASQDAIRARDAFLSIASHELNTPLTSLKLQLQLLEHGIERLPQAEAARAQLGPKFQVVQRQLRRLANLVTELLDLSRITAGRLRLEPEPVDVVALVHEVVARAAEDLSRAGCALSLRLPEQLAGHFDRLRLDQVVTNLLSNAMKYGQGRPIELTLEPVSRQALGLAGDGGALHLRVKDHGIGIDPAHQTRLFRRFERLESERHYSGFGLGLWIVKQILDAMGGRVGVHSALGEGACFEVLLPLAPSEPPARA